MTRRRRSPAQIALEEKLSKIGAKPTRKYLTIDLTDEDIAKHRRIYCKHYDDCLDLAFMGEWTSWSCSKCPIKEDISDDEKRDQAFEIYKTLKARRDDNTGG